jgi:carbon monoxide dehydrogenase subunit G
MDLSGSRLIPAPLAAVRAGLQDPEALKACIPGCESLKRTGEGAYAGTVATKVGPIRAALVGTLTVVETADGWRLAAEGADAAAGSGRGTGTVSLESAEGGTLLTYEGSAEVEGKIGQLGSRLLSGVTRQSIEGFLAAFSERVATDAATSEKTDAEPPLAEAPPLVHEEPAIEPTPEEFPAPPLAEEAPRMPIEPTPIAPTAVPDVPDPVEIAAADAVENPKDASGFVGRIMLVAAIAVVVAVAVYFGFMHRPPA